MEKIARSAKMKFLCRRFQKIFNEKNVFLKGDIFCKNDTIISIIRQVQARMITYKREISQNSEQFPSIPQTPPSVMMKSTVLTKTGTQLEPPGTGRNQLELAENHLESPVYISEISWNHQTRVKNQLLSWNQQWFHILRYLNFCKTKIRTQSKIKVSFHQAEYSAPPLRNILIRVI